MYPVFPTEARCVAKEKDQAVVSMLYRKYEVVGNFLSITSLSFMLLIRHRKI